MNVGHEILLAESFTERLPTCSISSSIAISEKRQMECASAAVGLRRKSPLVAFYVKAAIMWLVMLVRVSSGLWIPNSLEQRSASGIVNARLKISRFFEAQLCFHDFSTDTSQMVWAGNIYAKMTNESQ
jgi:hypothetical protein